MAHAPLLAPLLRPLLRPALTRIFDPFEIDPSLKLHQNFRLDAGSTMAMAARRGPVFTLTRPSTGWYFNEHGDLVSAAADVPRFHHDFITGVPRGLLHEEYRKNWVYDNPMAGASVGNPGTLPTRWAETLRGVNREVTELGTFNNIDYINIRLWGTPTGDPVINFELAVNVDALQNEDWTLSSYMSKNGGDFSNIGQIQVFLSERNEAGGFLATNSGADIKGDITAILKRFEVSATLSNASTAHVQPGVVVRWDDSGDIDITLRIGLPQIEKTNMDPGFASSPIKTGTGPVDRSSDSAQTNDVRRHNPVEGTFLFEGSADAVNQSADQHMFQIDDGGPTNLIRMFLDGNTDDAAFETVNSAGNNGLVTASGIVAGQDFKFAGGYADGIVKCCLNGGTVFKEIGADHPIASTFTVLQLGVNSGAILRWNGPIGRFKYWDRLKPDSFFQRITA